MRRKLLTAGAALVILGGAVAGLVLTSGSGGEEPAANTALPPATARVTRTTLVETKRVTGTLGYGDPAPISAAGTGTLTWIARVGSTVKRGEPLFKVDERPVVALYGALPLYRALRAGRKGADVAQLERNLADLGYAGFTVDDSYSSATAAAVRSWQADLGLAATGTVEPGQVVFTRGAVRIAGHEARVGDSIGGGSAERGGSAEGGVPVLSYTGTSRRVSVELEVADRALAAKGRKVKVTVPGRRAVNGKISRVGTVVTAQDTTPEGTAPDEGATPEGTSPAASDASIEVTVRIANQKALGSLNAAPVDVDLVSEEREDVLAVPVAALLALPKGGFGVEVVDGDRTRTVAVKTGVFAAGHVEVSGKGIGEGMRVGVPK
jgi:peptidoglycan hydrolase-like protein with peptidoglycan-binding domain